MTDIAAKSNQARRVMTAAEDTGAVLGAVETSSVTR
jgi:hypothetical protein